MSDFKTDTQDWTWGCELEIGDVPKKFQIPPNLGSWEYSETDIVNLNPPYRGIAADPLGKNPPVGGEINLRPSETWAGQVSRIQEILDLFRASGHQPTTSFISHTHVHVHVPGLRESVEGLKKLTAWVRDNQESVVRRVGGYRDLPEIESAKGARSYLLYDGGRLMPDWLSENLITKTDNFNKFIDLHCMGKDGESRGRPIRYAINMYCLKHTQTIEMRFFRASLEPQHLSSCFEFTERMIKAALITGETADQILDSKTWSFPPFWFDEEIWASHQRTKHKANVQGKNRAFWIAR